MKRTFRYFISYSTPTGFGNTELQRSQLIQSHQDVTEIGNAIADQGGWPYAIVLNFIKLPDIGTERL